MLENKILELISINTRISKNIVNILDIHTSQISTLNIIIMSLCVLIFFVVGWLYKLSSDIKKLKNKN